MSDQNPIVYADMRLTLLCITVLSIGPGLKAQTGRPKANDDAFIQAKARAIAEYRLVRGAF